MRGVPLQGRRRPRTRATADSGRWRRAPRSARRAAPAVEVAVRRTLRPDGTRVSATSFNAGDGPRTGCVRLPPRQQVPRLQFKHGSLQAWRRGAALTRLVGEGAARVPDALRAAASARPGPASGRVGEACLHVVDATHRERAGRGRDGRPAGRSPARAASATSSLHVNSPPAASWPARRSSNRLRVCSATGECLRRLRASLAAPAPDAAAPGCHVAGARATAPSTPASRAPRLLRGTVTADPSGLRAVKIRLTRRRGKRCSVLLRAPRALRGDALRAWLVPAHRRPRRLVIPAALAARRAAATCSR